MLQQSLFENEQGGAEVTLLSGGFPCQPHSLAGKRQASNDERDLWEKFARIIREVRPKWVLGENVPGILSSEFGQFFGRILGDLAGMGYSVGWCCFPASAVGANFEGKRVFVVATTNSKYVPGSIGKTLQRIKILQGEFYTRSIKDLRDRPAVYQPKLCGTFNGIPRQVDRLKCLGNSVVPQQVYPILKAIAEIEANLPI